MTKNMLFFQNTTLLASITLNVVNTLANQKHPKPKATVVKDQRPPLPEKKEDKPASPAPPPSPPSAPPPPPPPPTSAAPPPPAPPAPPPPPPPPGSPPAPSGGGGGGDSDLKGSKWCCSQSFFKNRKNKSRI